MQVVTIVLNMTVKRVMPAVLILASLMLGGCDFIRAVAGRPTSGDIEAMRVAAAREEALAKAEREAAEAAEAARRYTADSLAAVEFFGQEKCPMIDAAQIKSLDVSSAGTKYAIIVGAFSQAGNARAFADRLSGLGYDAAVIRYTNGHEVVGVCPTDDIVRLAEVYPKVKSEKFCPPEAWILVKNR